MFFDWFCIHLIHIRPLHPSRKEKKGAGPALPDISWIKANLIRPQPEVAIYPGHLSTSQPIDLPASVQCFSASRFFPSNSIHWAPISSLLRCMTWYLSTFIPLYGTSTLCYSIWGEALSVGHPQDALYPAGQKYLFTRCPIVFLITKMCSLIDSASI